MKYELLTDQQKRQVVDGMLRQMEAQYFNTELELGKAKVASNSTQNVQNIEQLQTNKDNIEKQVEYLRAEAEKLPKVEVPATPTLP